MINLYLTSQNLIYFIYKFLDINYYKPTTQSNHILLMEAENSKIVAITRDLYTSQSQNCQRLWFVYLYYTKDKIGVHAQRQSVGTYLPLEGKFHRNPRRDYAKSTRGWSICAEMLCQEIHSLNPRRA